MKWLVNLKQMSVISNQADVFYAQSDDFALVENRGLTTLKDLSIRWEILQKEIW